MGLGCWGCHAMWVDRINHLYGIGMSMDSLTSGSPAGCNPDPSMADIEIASSFPPVGSCFFLSSSSSSSLEYTALSCCFAEVIAIAHNLFFFLVCLLPFLVCLVWMLGLGLGLCADLSVCRISHHTSHHQPWVPRFLSP